MRALKATGGFPSVGFANSTRAAPSGARTTSPARTVSTEAGLKSSAETERERGSQAEKRLINRASLTSR